jgi:hypothetical protein
MKKVRGQPITGSKTAMVPKAPVLNDAKETSLDLEKRIAGRATQPFTNKGGAATTSASAKAPGGISTMEPRIKSGLQHSNPGAKALPSGGAVGYSKLPNQSKQIGGRFGFPPPARKAGAQNLSSVKRNRSFYGQA